MMLQTAKFRQPAERNAAEQYDSKELIRCKIAVFWMPANWTYLNEIIKISLTYIKRRHYWRSKRPWHNPNVPVTPPLALVFVFLRRIMRSTQINEKKYPLRSEITQILQSYGEFLRMIKNNSIKSFQESFFFHFRWAVRSLYKPIYQHHSSHQLSCW